MKCKKCWCVIKESVDKCPGCGKFSSLRPGGVPEQKSRENLLDDRTLDDVLWHAFSWKGLIVFITLGPSFAFFISGRALGWEAVVLFLMFVLPFLGIPWAVLVWGGYSCSLVVVYWILCELFKKPFPPPKFGFFIGAVLGALWNLFAWWLWYCLKSPDWMVHQQMELLSQYPISIVPGTLCGSLTCGLWCSRRYELPKQNDSF